MDYPSRVCEHCKKEFKYTGTRSLNAWLTQKYCSRSCANAAKTKYVDAKICLHCGSRFGRPQSVSIETWKTRKYCTRDCSDKAKDARHLKSFQFTKGNDMGRYTTESTAGENNIQWKGDDASYAAKHMWVKYHYGKPSLCEHCGSTDRKMYHWANISRQFKRERTDWLRLCVPCHKKYDLTERI